MSAAACERCGCTLEAALMERDGVTHCYECATGRRFEEHHPFGRTVPLTIRLRGNVHRALSDRRTDPLLLAALLLAEPRNAQQEESA